MGSDLCPDFSHLVHQVLEISCDLRGLICGSVLSELCPSHNFVFASIIMGNYFCPVFPNLVHQDLEISCDLWGVLLQKGFALIMLIP